MGEPRFKPENYEILTEAGQNLCIRRSDGASIPICPGNRDYDEYCKIDPDGTLARRVDITPAPDTRPSKDEIIAALVEQVDALTTATETEKTAAFKEITKDVTEAATK